MFDKRFEQRLLMQQQADLYRHPLEVTRRQGKYIFIEGKKVLNLASNDYLGLGCCEQVKQKIADNFRRYGACSSSSRLVSGHYSAISQAEKAYARHFGYEEALFFSSGYQANLGIIATLFGQGDTILFDKHIHASSVNGMILSRSKMLGYTHNSMSHLQKRLASRKKNQTAVLTESLFSMDGDFLALDGFKELKDRYGFMSIVDEAHAFGTIGQNGRGMARDVADIAVGTLGKALGLFGAFVLLPKRVKTYLFNFCAALIYSTTLPEAHAVSALDVLEITSRAEAKRELLRRNSNLMQEHLRSAGFKTSGDAHIIAIEIGSETAAQAIAKHLLEEGIFVFAARYPTVPLGKAILRISMTALHSAQDIARFVCALKGAYEKVQQKMGSTFRNRNRHRRRQNRPGPSSDAIL